MPTPYQTLLDPKNNPLGYSARRYFVDEFHFRTVPALPEGSRILDVGGHKRPKRGIFDIDRYSYEVVYANLTPDRRPDVQSDAARLAFAGGVFDAAICSELLEHVPDPRDVLKEIHRVLKPGGRLLICVPFLYRIHGDPYDFGRYTEHFWRANLSSLGFEIVSLEKQGLFFSVLLDFARQWTSEYKFRRPAAAALRGILGRVHHWTLRHERRPKVENHPFFSSFTTGYGIVARKQPKE